MASIATVVKKTAKPLRLMGAGSHDVEGSPLYFEYGTFNIADSATTGTLATKLTNVIAAIFTPLNSYAVTAKPYSDLVVASSAITVANTNPNGSTGNFSYLLIGTVETV